MEVKRE